MWGKLITFYAAILIGTTCLNHSISSYKLISNTITKIEETVFLLEEEILSLRRDITLMRQQITNNDSNSSVSDNGDENTRIKLEEAQITKNPIDATHVKSNVTGIPIWAFNDVSINGFMRVKNTAAS